MKLVAVARSPKDAEQGARAVAAATGLTMAEARMRLAPEPPVLVARLEPDEAQRVVAELRKEGLAALAVEGRCPTDHDRTVARTFALEASGLVLTPRFGEPLAMEWGDVVAVLRGTRVRRAETTTEEKSKSLSVGTAIATGGLKFTRTETKSVRSSDERAEQVILVYGRDGSAGAMIEGEVDFSCLGIAMQPSSTGNMTELSRRLRERTPGAFHDDRLMRLGRRPLPFLAGGESLTASGSKTTMRTDSTGSLDTLAEVLRQALAEKLLP